MWNATRRAIVSGGSLALLAVPGTADTPERVIDLTRFGDLSAQHFSGRTLSTDSGASSAKPFHKSRNGRLRRYRGSNKVYRVLQ